MEAFFTESEPDCRKFWTWLQENLNLTSGNSEPDFRRVWTWLQENLNLTSGESEPDFRTTVLHGVLQLFDHLNLTSGKSEPDFRRIWTWLQDNCFTLCFTAFWLSEPDFREVWSRLQETPFRVRLGFPYTVNLAILDWLECRQHRCICPECCVIGGRVLVLFEHSLHDPQISYVHGFKQGVEVEVLDGD